MLNEIINWIREEVKKTNAKGVIVAVSGGIDSAVVASLAVRSFPSDSIGLWLDIDSSLDSNRNAQRVFSKLNMRNLRVNLQPTFDNLVKTIFEVGDPYRDLETYEEFEKTGVIPIDKTYINHPNIDLIKGNLKARIRMASLYAHAQRNNYLVLSTSNLCEIEIGYYTKWGDGVGDIAPIAHLLKSEIYELAKELNIPKEVINAYPSADLWEGQTDEKEMGFTYDELEKFIKNEKISNESKMKIESLKKNNIHKQNEIPYIKK